MINILLFLSIISINENTEAIPKDTLPVKDNSFWEKLGFGFGYSGGICYTGQDLRKSDGWKVLPWDLIAEQLYWLNSIEGSVTYPVNEDWGIEVGLGYEWVKTGGTGLEPIYYMDSTTGEDYSIGTGEWKLYANKLEILKTSKVFNYGIELIFAYPRTVESKVRLHPSYEVIEEHIVTRYCLGGSVLLRWESGLKISRLVKLVPFLSVKIGMAKEVKNNSPWEWNDKLELNFSGLYIGLKLEF